MFYGTWVGKTWDDYSETGADIKPRKVSLGQIW